MLSCFYMDNINKDIIEQIAGFLADELSPAEVQSLRQWLAASDENRKYFEEIKVIWQATGSVDTSVTYHPEKAWQKVAGKRPERTYSNRQEVSMNLIPPKVERIIKRTLQVAAAIAVIFSGGALTSYFMLKSDIDQAKELAILADSKYEMVAPRGSKSIITLPDGSIVVLNAASKITYSTNFGFSSRELSLEGEAYFNVRTNPDKPFTIHTSDIDVLAFGTAFNVKAYPEDPTIVTTLEHGELRVNSRNDNSLDVTLKPKQNVVYYKNNPIAVKQEISTNNRVSPSVEKNDVPVVTVSEDVNVSLHTSWKDTEWLIESQTFGELAGSLERRYNIRMIFGSNDLRNYRFSGTIRNETIEQILNVLTFSAPMKYTIEQGVVRLQIDAKRKSSYDTLLRNSQ